jgi:hypothetical protein
MMSSSSLQVARHCAFCGPPSRREILVMQQKALGQSAASSQRMAFALQGWSLDLQTEPQQY